MSFFWALMDRTTSKLGPFLVYWSPSGSHSAATQFLSRLSSAPQLLSYYFPRCHLVEKLPLFTHVGPSDKGVQLSEISTGAEGHWGERSDPNTPFFLLSPLYFFPLFAPRQGKEIERWGYQNNFWAIRMIFAVLSCQWNTTSINNYCITFIKKILCLLLLCLIFLIWEFLPNLA